MPDKIEHIGIAVRNAEESIQLFNKLLQKQPYKEENVASESVKTIFYQMGDCKIELLAATDATSSISTFLEKRGEGMHHIAFLVDNIYEEIERLKGEGFRFVNETPKAGADNKLIVFIHPKTANGVLIELCQEIK